MASVVAKKEEEKKRESHKQSLLKVLSLVSTFMYVRACTHTHRHTHTLTHTEASLLIS